MIAGGIAAIGLIYLSYSDSYNSGFSAGQQQGFDLSAREYAPILSQDEEAIQGQDVDVKEPPCVDTVYIAGSSTTYTVCAGSGGFGGSEN